VTLWCADTSAWHHATNSAVAARWDWALRGDEIGLCDQARLEILYSARSSSDYTTLAMRLAALPPIPSTEDTFRRALDLQRRLAHHGEMHHRSVTVADLLIAAAAEAAGAVVWHYDEDYDRIAAVTGQPTEWIAPRGSL
jgi:predicted nucleic acid-binding protein